MAAVEGSCIRIVEIITKELMQKAGALKVAHRLSLADAIAVATALDENAFIVTPDHHELAAVAKSGDAEIFWIRFNTSHTFA